MSKVYHDDEWKRQTPSAKNRPTRAEEQSRINPDDATLPVNHLSTTHSAATLLRNSRLDLVFLWFMGLQQNLIFTTELGDFDECHTVSDAPPKNINHARTPCNLDLEDRRSYRSKLKNRGNRLPNYGDSCLIRIPHKLIFRAKSNSSLVFDISFSVVNKDLAAWPRCCRIYATISSYLSEVCNGLLSISWFLLHFVEAILCIPPSPKSHYGSKRSESQSADHL